MKTRKIVWNSLIDSTTELLTLESGEGYKARGLVVGAVNDVPVGLTYRLRIDPNWEVNEVVIVSDGAKPFEAYFVRKAGKWYDEKDNHQNEFDEAHDVDITLTPFTNTLPIRRLGLQDQESREITVIYFDLAEARVVPVRQRYTNLGNNNYRFEHPETGFVTVIEIDDEGFVVNYPGLFKMVFPARTPETL